MSPRSGWRRDGFATRLMVAQLGVLLASVATAAVVAAVVGPRLFHAHLLRARGTLNDDQVLHAERAYLDSNLVSLGVALVIAVGSASIVTLLLARRLRRPLVELSSAASAVAGGRYDRRVAATGAGAELDEFASSFNTMATRLQVTEDTRRRLLTDLAHEMRTPLATCTAYLEALDDGVATWGPETSEVMSHQVQRLSRLAADIDDVSRAEEGRLSLQVSDVELGRFFLTVAENSRARFEDKGVELSVSTPTQARASVRGTSSDSRRSSRTSWTTPSGTPAPVAALNWSQGSRARGRRPGERRRRRHPSRAAAPHLRAVLPGRHRPGPQGPRVRCRPDHQPGHRRDPRGVAVREQPGARSGIHLRGATPLQGRTPR